MLFLLIVLSFYSTGSIRNAEAFDFALPDIPFLNFNLGNNDNSDNEQSPSEEELYDISNLVSDDPEEIGRDDSSDESASDNSILDLESEGGIQLYDSLPFPSNSVSNAIFGQNSEEEKDEIESEREFNQISSYIPNSLPLISDYTDFPSTYLADPNTETGQEIPNQYIVVLKDDDSGLSDFFSTISDKLEFQGVELLQVYEKVLNGIAVKVPNESVIEAIERLPMVDYVENDVMTQAFAQTVPTGINRVDADMSSAKSGNGNGIVDIDIAILDSGIDLKHSDLNVYHQKSFVTTNTGFYSLFGSRTSTTANDDNGHGTHVAGIAAAKDNTVGSVGVAPGAKLWAIKVLDSKGTGPLSTVIKGIDYITQYANQIEVANLSLGCECKSTAFDTAINNSVNAGIVFVVAAGNAGKDAITNSPANNPNVISVSAVGDSDGKCGGNGPDTGYGKDDALASFSNYGSVVDIAAPGTKIYSTYKGNTFATMSGTSMASPHVAGAAALYLSNNPDATPLTVKSALMSQGSNIHTSCDGNGFGYFTGDKDSVREPLLYVRNN
jgi:subtilisin family serine protease